jgi:hypothetical protein
VTTTGPDIRHPIGRFQYDGDSSREAVDVDLERAYIHPEQDHPEQDHPVPMREVIATYAWHGRHHTAHIMTLRDRHGWT